jgi:predicted acylesterase/phospholipase RssA
MALSGGGLEGFLFQLGVLRALDVGLRGRNLQSIEVFSGISSGSIAASLVAGGVPTLEVIKAMYGKSEILDPLTPSTLYDIAAKDIGRRILRQTTMWTGLEPNKWLRNAMSSIPTGFFKGDALKNYFKAALDAFKCDDNFKSLKSELYIGATDQDSFEHVVFGKEPWRDVPVSDALRASCALPPFFVPSRIRDRWFVDGQITKTCNLELVVQRLCRLVFIIDPLKPLATPIPGTVDRQGGFYALIQTIKALVYTRFRQTLQHITERFPDVDFIVFQPDEECAQLMAGSPMRYRVRTKLITLAYRHTLRQLRERHLIYSAKLGRFGFSLKDPDELLTLEQDEQPFGV